MDEKSNKGIIFDLDGTLYFQKPVRRDMFFALLKYYLRHWREWKQGYALFIFRRIREKEEFSSMSYDQQLKYVSRKVKIDKKELEEKIEYWMFYFPLCLIRKYQDKALLSFLKNEQKKGKKIIIYSDYPVEKKLNSLNIEPDFIFYPGIHGITCMKPSLEAMRCILDRIRMEPETLLFVGDREEKDGISAELVNIPFVLVHSEKSRRRKP